MRNSDQDLLFWIAEKHQCEKCGKIMTEKYGSGRFCCRSCANSHVKSEESKQKLRNTQKATGISLAIKSKQRHNLAVEKYQKNPNLCAICGKNLPYEKRNRKTCSRECTKKQLSISASKNKHNKIYGKLVIGKHIVYKTTCLLDGRFYIGVRKTESKDFDGYLGSGIILKRLVRKYGKENFSRETLFEFDNSKQAFDKERELLIDLNLLKNPLCINIANEGQGGNTFSGKHHSHETRLKLSQIRREWNKTLSKEKKRQITLKRVATRKAHAVSAHNKGKIRITNGKVIKYIFAEELDKYLAEGFFRK